MVRLIIFLLVASFNLSNTLKAQVSYPIDAANSVVSFSVGFAGGISEIQGRFSDWSGTISYSDPNDITTLSCEVVFKTKSLLTGDAERDSDISGKGYFDVEEYPEITFTSKNVEKTGDGLVMVGDFTLLGIKKEIRIPFKRNHETPIAWVFGEPRIALKGSITLDRMEYNIPARGWNGIVPSLGKMMLSKEVIINIVVQGVGKGSSALMAEEIETNGVKAALNLYLKLEKEHKGKETYVLGERVFNSLTLNLIRSEKNEEALEIAKFSIKNSQTFLSYYVLGMAHKSNGNKDKAIENFNKSLELNPNFARAKSEIDSLK